jgi:hypothetical protein
LQPCGDAFDSFDRPARCFEDDRRFERGVQAIADVGGAVRLTSIWKLGWGFWTNRTEDRSAAMFRRWCERKLQAIRIVFLFSSFYKMTLRYQAFVTR